MNQKCGVEQIAVKLAAIVSKPEQDIQLLMKKVIYTNKHKELKQEIEKTQSMVKQIIDANLKESNGKALSELPPNFVLNLSKHETVVANFTKDLENYCAVTNTYL